MHNVPKPGVPESFKVLVKELQALCLDIRVLDEQGNEIELKEDDDDDDVVYSSGSENEEVVVGDTNDVLDAGFVIDEDGPDDDYGRVQRSGKCRCLRRLRIKEAR